jgi:hypothetical protein
MFKPTHIIKENNGDHSFDVGTKVFFATEPKSRNMYDDETIENGKWYYFGLDQSLYVVLEDEDGVQQSVLSTEFKEIA